MYLMKHWRKRFSVTLKTFNVRIITQAYLPLLDKFSVTYQTFLVVPP